MSNAARHERRARDPVTRSTARVSRSSARRSTRKSPRGEGKKKKSAVAKCIKRTGSIKKVARALGSILLRLTNRSTTGYSLDRVLADPELASKLSEKCREFSLPGTPKDWNHLLLGLRKAGKLIRLQTRKRTEFTWSDYDEFLFSSEIAWSEMGRRDTLDDILCDPELAKQFDEIASKFAPGFTPLQYRWGALTLRKKSKTLRDRSELFTSLSLDEFKPILKLRSWKNERAISNSPGLYVVSGRSRQEIYVGGTLNLHNRLSTQFAAEQLDDWEKKRDAKFISFLRKPEVTDPIDLLSMQKRLIQLANPSLNVLGPTAA